MSFITAIKNCFAKYADFNGRASRSEYWWLVLATCIAGFAGGLIHLYVGILALLVFTIPLLSSGARRMQDIGKPGWLIAFTALPWVGVVMMYFLVLPSQPEANEHGAPPSA